jgi:hypothetical protein
VPQRTNYHGRQVAFPLGALLLLAAVATLAAEPSRWLVFLVGVGCLGLIDDLAGADTDTRSCAGSSPPAR